MIDFTSRSFAAVAAIVATIGTVGAAAPAQAQTASATVSYTDLDLASSAGQVVLARRVRHAVDAVCGRADARDPSRDAIAACRRDALAAGTSDARLAATAAQDRTVRLAAK